MDDKVLYMDVHIEDGEIFLVYSECDDRKFCPCREYYKCESRGCPARKHVQKSDDDSSTFVVTYEGRHTCLKTVTEPKI